MRKKPRISDEETTGCGDQDYVSSMPDDVLVSIVCRLPLKDAVITSSLSSRWRYLWTLVTDLDFDADDRLNKIAADPKSRSSERSKYINWVNRVVRNHGSFTLNKFRICFDLDKGSKVAIDKWLKFAMTKRAKRLELDLLENGETLRHTSRNYTFPYKPLSQAKASSLRGFFPSNRGASLGANIGLKTLEFLSLKSVNVNDEALQFFLSSCPAIRYLSIHGSGSLVNVKITGKSLALKYLEIVFCSGIKSIRICDTNLVSFNYLGSKIDLFISNVPRLYEVSMGQGYSGLANKVFVQLSSCLYQLEILTLDIYRPVETERMFTFPQLPNLKQLILKIGAWNDECLLEFTSLIEACPFLCRFVLQLIWMSPLRGKRKIRHAAESPHRFLKLVEIVGYYGRISDDEFVIYLIKNAICLQTIVIDPRHQILERNPTRTEQIKKEEANARMSAKKQLEAKKPPGVQLVIL